jgi:hypothetical protein
VIECPRHADPASPVVVDEHEPLQAERMTEALQRLDVAFPCPGRLKLRVTVPGQVGRDHPSPRRRECRNQVAPHVGALGEAMHEQHRIPARLVRSRLPIGHSRRPLESNVGHRSSLSRPLRLTRGALAEWLRSGLQSVSDLGDRTPGIPHHKRNSAPRLTTPRGAHMCGDYARLDSITAERRAILPFALTSPGTSPTPAARRLRGPLA